MENVVTPVTFSPTSSTSSSTPRSRRMGGIIQAPPFPSSRSVSMDLKPSTPPDSPKDFSPSISSPARTPPYPPPPPPPRSPLRPSPRSVASFTTLINMYAKRDTMGTVTPDQNEEDTLRNVASLSALLERFSLDQSDDRSDRPSTPTDFPNALDTHSLMDEKPLPIPPEDESPLNSPTSTIDLGMDASEISTVSTIPNSLPTITKREHALNEILESERAYAMDLAFICSVHIPLALGQSVPFHLPRPATPPGSSGSSSRTHSTASDSSSNSSHFGPPMTKDDVRIIFGNIKELATFSDMFCERLQEALGDVLKGGTGEDQVGALFLEVIPQMETPYKTYITKHAKAIEHLNSLPKTPALLQYFSETQHMATVMTRAWNISSLLIKPVQRLLKYSLLLTSVLEQTPDSHGDKENLRKARDRMEEVARGVNEGQRRMEVVKEVLTGKPEVGGIASPKRKKTLNKPSSMSLGRMKSMGMGLRASRPTEDNNVETACVDGLEKQLRTYDAFVREFAKDVYAWVQTVKVSQQYLREWAGCFGKTIGISDEHPSEAFNAFHDVIDRNLIPLCKNLEEVMQAEVLSGLARLLDSMKAPFKLLKAMHELEPLHYSLLNLNYSKHRPSPDMIDASQNYLALRGQLASDLPTYLKSLDKGVVACIRHLAFRQTDFWSEVRDHWGTLWDCLRIEGETNAGCEETLRLWWSRYSDVEKGISDLHILRQDEPIHIPTRYRSRSIGALPLTDPSTESSFGYINHLPNSPSSSFSGSIYRHYSRGSFDSSSPRRIRRTPSTETFPTVSPSYHGKSRPRTPESFGRQKARSKTSPLPASSSSPSLNHYTITSSSSSNNHSRREYVESMDLRNEFYTLKSRNSSFNKRISETLKAPLRRSPSQRSVASVASASTPFSNLTDNPPPYHRRASIPAQADLVPPNSPCMYYTCVVHACSPPRNFIYMDLPFFTLKVGDILGVLTELGHPDNCQNLPINVDSATDCLLVVKNEQGDTGLALASFLVPLDPAINPLC